MSELLATAVRGVVLVPTVAALAGLLAVRRGRAPARVIAVAGSAIALVLALVELLAVDTSVAASAVGTLPALRAGELAVPFQLQASGPVALIAMVVALVSCGVQVFSVRYLEHDDRYDVFAATVSLFSAGMLLVIHSADLLLTLVGWEVMGWCSYLLIGHWSRRESARAAALKAFLVTRLADVGFVLGVVLLASGPSSTAYPAVLAHWGTHPHGALRSVALSLLVIGVLGKSAQFPFHDWLPDAMEGPTPASALIHAATMVAAGTFVLAQLFPLLAASDPARWLLGGSVVVTMIGAGILAFGQSDLKRLLAYSTLSQVAIMLSPLAVVPAAQGPSAAILHLYSHAFFKALLFLTIGWLSLLAGGTSARLLRGSAAGQQVLKAAWFTGLIALAGLPVTVGGISKEKVLAAVEGGVVVGDNRALLVYAALLVTVVVTAAYSTRAFIVVGAAAVADAVADAVTHLGTDQRPATMDEAPATRAVPRSVVATIAVLGTGTFLGGLVTLGGWLGTTERVSLPMLLLSLLLIAIGALAAFSTSRGGDPAERLVGERMTLFDTGLGVEEVYRVVVARPVLALARLVAFLDTEVVDAYVRGSAAAARLAGVAGGRAHRRERSATGLVWVLLGALAAAAAGVLLWS